MIERCGVSMDKLGSKDKYEPKALDASAPVVWGFKPKGGAGVVDAIKDAMGL
jgi:hypothetical protein